MHRSEMLDILRYVSVTSGSAVVYWVMERSNVIH